MNSQVVIDGQSPLLLTQPRYLIGRGDGCEILLPEGDAGISRRHALLECDSQGRWSIVDLGSRNGTLVNGESLTDRRNLGDGDRISVGQSRITLALPPAQPPAQPTIAVEAPVLPQPPRAAPTVAYKAPADAPPSNSESPRNYDSPLPMPEPHPLPASLYAPPPTQWIPPAVTRPADSGSSRNGSSGMGFVITGVALIAISLVTYLAYIEPKMTAYQSAAGQLAGGLMSLFGNNSYYQQFQMLYYERIACIIGGFLGAGSVLLGVLMRR